MPLKDTLLIIIVGIFISLPSQANAAKYTLDIKGTHAFIQFKIQHLGYSWIIGQFNKFDGQLRYDNTNEAASKISIVIDTASIDTNHKLRDKHLRGDKFLDVKQFPQATFTSTKYKPTSPGKAILTGDFTFHGVTKSIDIDVHKMGEGKDPWGGERIGFEGSTKFKLKDYNINKKLSPASAEVELYFTLEGIK
ncbi:MAG: YceI family protein, partial [Colwellia sp.]|nr:YceI family protein [Colwellia sp.]